MSGSSQGHVRVMSRSCQGHVRAMKGSCQLEIISIVKFTRHLETEGFSVLLFPDTSVLLKLRHHSDLDSYIGDLMM